MQDMIVRTLPIGTSTGQDFTGRITSAARGTRKVVLKIKDVTSVRGKRKKRRRQTIQKTTLYTRITAKVFGKSSASLNKTGVA